jgi:hypothetical protein
MGERIGQIAKVPEVKQSSSNSRVQRSKRLQSMNTPVDRILFLQITAGNQAVSRLMRSGALQAKLRIGQPGDKYEQEADRVADAVMRMPEPGVQRQAEEKEEETLQSKPLVGDYTTTGIPPIGHDFSRISVFPQNKEASTASIFEDEKVKPEDAEDAIGALGFSGIVSSIRALTHTGASSKRFPTAATHKAIVSLRNQNGLATHRALAYGYTAWSPRRNATFPTVNITWQKAGTRWTGVVRRTNAAMGAMKALYLKPDTYLIPGATTVARYPQCGPSGKRVPMHSKVNIMMSLLAQTAEQEHCDDYKRAFNLSLKKCANLINAIAGRRFGPGTRRAIELMILRRIGGKTPRQWVQELNRLIRLSLNRDIQDHRLKTDGNPKTCPDNCSKLVYTTVKSPTTKIPGPSSQNLIK